MITLPQMVYTCDEWELQLPYGTGGWMSDTTYLCNRGLEEVFGVELELSNSYEIRIYPKRPRTEAVEFRLHEHYITGEAILTHVESGQEYGVDSAFLPIIEGQNPSFRKDEKKWVLFARILDCGIAPQDVHYADVYMKDAGRTAMVTLTSESGGRARVEVDLATVEWEF